VLHGINRRKEGPKMGMIYKRKWKDPKTGEEIEGKAWWIKYYRHGKPYRESSKSEKETVAKRLLKQREGEIAEGKIPGVYFDKVKFEDLAKDFLTDYRVNERDTLNRATWVVECLKKSFEGMRVTDITTDRIQAHVEKRMEDGLANASINRELAALKRMFNLAARCTPPKVNLVPYIPMLKESNVRKGFFEIEEFIRLRNVLPSYVKPVVTFAYHTGWREGEIFNLTWDKVDLKEGIIVLNPGETKNEGARTLYLNEELLKEIKALQNDRQLGCPYIFHYNGNKIKSLKTVWKTACIKAGLCEPRKDENGNIVVKKLKKGKVKEKIEMRPTKLFHDFRRTGVRNMVRAGIPERVAMMISGHKTRSVFERYNIVSNQDLKEAAKKTQIYHEKLNGNIDVQDLKRGEIVDFKRPEKKGTKNG
jgi:integrase